MSGGTRERDKAAGATITLEDDVAASKQMKPGSVHYRAYVGPPQQYDFMGATQFSLVTALGLREEHTLLDIGCGSLRSGRFLIQYLLPDRYFGIEPNEYLWRDALEHESGWDLYRIKRPRFSARDDFLFSNDPSIFDFIVAQSVFSHTGRDLLDKGIAAIARQLAPSGQALFTAIVEDSASSAWSPPGWGETGWLYPGCYSYRTADVAALAADHGLLVEKLNWFHPRQTWFRAVTAAEMLLSSQSDGVLGDGRVLFDSRFKGNT